MELLKNKRIVVVLIALCLFGLVSIISVVAKNSVALVIGGEDIVSWSVDNIAPGESGAKNVTVRNHGSSVGDLYIWISNIVDLKGLNAELGTDTIDEPGKLSLYMRFGVSSPRLDTTISMPALLSTFPENVNRAAYIKIPNINPGQTVSLTWTWELPAIVGNNVQGSTLSFDINYALERTTSQITTLAMTTPAHATKKFLLPIIATVCLAFNFFC
jgi:hypothetical protein